MYVMKEEKGNPLSREEVDKKFYNAMLAAAGDSLYYQIKAKVYYGIVRAVGWYFWRY
jgi:DNA-binding FadR family transcriptional regulator